LNITVKPFLPVKVSVPEKIDFEKAEATVLENTKWILREQEKMQLIEQQHSHFAINENYQFKDRIISIEVGNDEHVKSVRNAPLEKTIFLEYTAKKLTEEHVSYIIYDHIIPEMKDWCKVNLVPKVRELAEKHHIEINKVSIRDNTTRWGSLGKNNDMNLSLYLATLPRVVSF
jgi:predicted metal-dependent hydrolase